MAEPSCIVFNCADPGNPVPVGRFALDGAGRGRFGYGLRYLERDGALELDPIHLPLTPAEIDVAPSADGTFGVLSDAGPNTWGMQLALRRLRESNHPPPANAIEWLLNSGYYGSGCLGFSPDPGTLPHPGPPPLSSNDFSGRVLRALEAYIADPEARLDAQAATLLFPGSSLGGIRPKTVVMHEGREYIAKFSRPDDLFDVPAVEYATLRLADKAGVATPDFELIQRGGRSILLVERFDRTRDGKRIHYASAYSLLNPGHVSPDGREYVTSFSYAGIAEVIRQIGRAPREDAQQLFRRMVLNIMVGNVDDHLRNHALLMEDGRRYRLSAAFDIVPHLDAPTSPQSIGVGALGRASTIRNALSQCGRFMLTDDEAWDIVNDVKAAASAWRQVFAESGVSARDIHTLQHCFAVADEPDRVQVAVKNDIVAWPAHLEAVHGQLRTGYETVATSDLKGFRLDYALAGVCHVETIRLDYFPGLRMADVRVRERADGTEFVRWNPTANPALAQDILKRFGLAPENTVSALRSIVMKNLGPTVNIPVPRPIRHKRREA